MIGSKEQPRVAVLVTYSSVISEGPQVLPTNAEQFTSHNTGTLPVPSKLSLLAALASREALSEVDDGQLWIAGEESYTGFNHTTGTLLVEGYRDLLPENYVPVVFLPGTNRLINTPYQIEAIVDRCHAEGVDELTFIGWGFHELRVKRLLKAHDPSLTADYVRTEDALNAMEPAVLQEHLEALGFMVDFQTIMQTGLKKYKKREWLTRQSLLFGRKGQVINYLSSKRGAGRSDDLDAWGNAVMSTTKQVEPSLSNVRDSDGQIAIVD